jgi:lipopolysaccharide/colanic/teichoic acid biosynthesis glycosyltransferase
MRRLLLHLDHYLRRSNTSAARAIETVSPQRGRIYRHSATKRFIDILVSVIGLLLSGPLIVTLIAISKGLDREHSILFVQERVGPGLKPLGVVKLRTMRPAERVGWRHDPPQVTRFGRLLRRYHLDELPQLVHVLHGDLSAVGIRVLPMTVYRYLESAWSPERFAVWASAYDGGPLGLTGVHQVFRSGGKEDAQRFHRDLFYTRRASLGFDLYLIWHTVMSLGRTGE